jgi:sugar phosphate isomerase/epimerase
MHEPDSGHRGSVAPAKAGTSQGSAFSRRSLLAAATALVASSALPAQAKLPVKGSLPMVLFSKHLHWADYELAARLTRDTGFEGIDLTVRPGGHVEPERVREDLPRATEIFAKAGVPVVMITTNIQTPSTPLARDVLETAKSLGITHYRWNDFLYDPDKPLPAQLEALKPQVSALAKLNESLGLTAMYHIHSGFNRVGTSVWDLWSLLRDENPDRVSFNFDIGHATVEGGFGGWVNSLRLVLGHTRGTAVKDFYWEKNQRGEWRPRWCPLGEGMVDWPRYFEMLKAATTPMPLQLHLEYPEIGAAGSGRKQLDLPQQRVVSMIRRDAETLLGLRAKAGLG